MEFQDLGGGVGYLKAGFLGFNKSGKTYTAIELAIGTRKHFGLAGPIAMLDTEASAQYQAPRVLKETGQKLLGVQTRALGQAIEFLRECVNKRVSVAVIDSVTHLWRELCDSYLKQRNEALIRNGKNARTRLAFDDWGPLKAKWGEFADLYLTLPLHVIICGRAGYEYDYEEDDNGKKELIKTGIKMKTEGEFGFEPSLLVEMERIQVGADGKATGSITHRATVIGDRFSVIDGKVGDNPNFEFFRPYVALLSPSSHATVDTATQTPMNVDESGNIEWQREKKERTILSEEIAGLLTRLIPGQSAAEKKARMDACQEVFQTTSWTAIESMPSDKLRKGLIALPGVIERLQGNDVATPAEKATRKKVSA
jgi:hypothetical protein